MHVAPKGLLEAHSVAETYLFASLASCPRCHRRPLRTCGDLRPDASTPFQWVLDVQCAGCKTVSVLQFLLVSPGPPEDRWRINPTDDRSKLIDPAGWLALFHTILEGASREPNREEARGMTLEAVQCLDEALRFLDAGEEWPRESAFFSDASRARFREHPDSFRRSALLALKHKLPAVPARGPQGTGNPGKWWQFWRRK